MLDCPFDRYRTLETTWADPRLDFGFGIPSSLHAVQGAAGSKATAGEIRIVGVLVEMV